MMLPHKNEGSQETAETSSEVVIDCLQQFSPYGVITTDTSLLVTGWNQWMVFNSKIGTESTLGRGLLDLYPDLVERKMDRYFRAALLGQTALISHGLHDYLIPMKPGPARNEFAHMPQSATVGPLRKDGDIAGTITYIENVGERIQRERELEKHIAQLEDALREVKTLKGLLPICSYCKNIRDDEGYWNKVEAYLGKHSDLDFSHGICPECAKKYFPEYDLYGNKDE